MSSRSSFIRPLIVIAAILISSLSIALIHAHEASAENMMCECTNTYSDGTTKTEEGASTILFGDANSCYCGGINSVVRTAVNVLTVGIGLLGTLGIVWSGVVYMSARDDESQVAKAKKRLI